MKSTLTPSDEYTQQTHREAMREEETSDHDQEEQKTITLRTTFPVLDASAPQWKTADGRPATLSTTRKPMNTSPNHPAPPAPAAAHTPPPWEQRGNRIYTKGGLLIAELPKHGAGFLLAGDTAPWHLTEENAALIVRAVNSFDAMREALEKAPVTEWKAGTPERPWHKMARAALALATPPDRE